MLKLIDGGVCAAQGFKAAGIHVGVKTHADWKKDVALIVSDVDCAASAVFTKNVVKAAPIHVDRAHLADGKARAIIANSGNANACAPHGEENAEKMCAAAAKAIGCKAEDVLVSSTGVIGQTLNVKVIEDGVPELYSALAATPEASDAAAHAIMTTDTEKKEAAVETVIGGKVVRMGGIAKGSGMIHPNMGTMLCFLTTDCAISPEMIRTALLETVNVSFNRISVDGDTSTNDSCIVLANGMAGNPVITEKGGDYAAFLEALQALCMTLAKSSEPLVKAYSNSTLKLSLTKNSSTAAPTLSSVMSTVPTLKETISTCSISRPYRPKTTRNTQQSTYRILPSRLLRLTTTSSLKQSITKKLLHHQGFFIIPPKPWKGQALMRGFMLLLRRSKAGLWAKQRE